jgi:hypothetical protein
MIYTVLVRRKTLPKKQQQKPKEKQGNTHMNHGVI